MWARSSAGRAPESHSGGRGFDSPRVHFPTRQFRQRWWRIFFPLGLVFLLQCTDTALPPSDQTPLQLEIRTSLLGGTEGFPDTLYAFVLHSNHRLANVRIYWDFGDGTFSIQSQPDTVYHQFTAEGSFTVWVGVYDKRSQDLLGSAAHDVNIRRTLPQFSMVRIPAGSFWMGSDLRYEERPVHRVTISRPFWITTTEVTQQQWQQLMGYNPSWFQGDNRPVEQVSWYEVIDFCNRLSLRAGLTPCYRFSGDTILCDFSANGYRLPTEAEWEYACRAGTTGDFANGSLDNPYLQCEDIPLVDSIAWYCGNADFQTHPVGQKAPNPWGLYDMHGNVAEWVWDVADATYYQRSPDTDPTGPLSLKDLPRTIRGGSWSDPIHYLRASARFFKLPPFRKTFNVGFRLVRNAE